MSIVQVITSCVTAAGATDDGFNARFVAALIQCGYVIVARDPVYENDEIWSPKPWRGGWKYPFPSAIVRKPEGLCDLLAEIEAHFADQGRFWPQHPVAEARPDGSLSVTNADGTKVVVAAGEGCSAHDGVVTPCAVLNDGSTGNRVDIRAAIMAVVHTRDPSTPESRAEYLASINAIVAQTRVDTSIPYTSPSAEIAVTDEMIAAAKLTFWDEQTSDEETFEVIYRAMAQKAPISLRDMWRQQRDEAWEKLFAMAAERDAAVASAALNASAVADLERKLMAERGETMRLRDALAKFTAANVAEAEVPKPNPFRSFNVDRRRVGG